MGLHDRLLSPAPDESASSCNFFFDKIQSENQVMSGQSYPNTAVRQRDPSSLTFINPASSEVLGYDLDLGSSGKLDFCPLFYQPWHGNSSLNSTLALDR